MPWYIYLIIFCIVLGQGVIIISLKVSLDNMVRLFNDAEKERKRLANSLREKGLECQALKKQIKRMERGR